MNTPNTLSARVVPEGLSDGSIAYDVHQPLGGGGRILFACVDEKHAQKLAALLDECVSFEIEQEP